MDSSIISPLPIFTWKVLPNQGRDAGKTFPGGMKGRDTSPKNPFASRPATVFSARTPAEFPVDFRSFFISNYTLVHIIDLEDTNVE